MPGVEIEGDATDVQLAREIFREAQVVRLHQPEVEKPISVARREKAGSFLRLLRGSRLKLLLSETGSCGARAGARVK